MSIRRLAGTFLTLAAALAATAVSLKVEAQTKGPIAARYAGLPANATHCDPSIPIFVEITPLTAAAVGKSARFEVKVESTLDPDLIKRSWVEYDLPARMRKNADLAARREILGRAGRGRTELEVVIPDESRYEIRARLVVQLINGQTISQTAVRWIDLGDEDPPEGMIGKIVNPDGTGIQVYRGATVRD